LNLRHSNVRNGSKADIHERSPERLVVRATTVRCLVEQALGKIVLPDEVVHGRDHFIVRAKPHGRVTVRQTGPDVAVPQTEDNRQPLFVAHAETPSPEGTTGPRITSTSWVGYRFNPA